MPNVAIPNIVKHMTIAIYRDGKISAKSKADRFRQCFQIAKARCAQYGYVVFQGSALSEAIGLTPKGRSAELRHKTEGRAKTGLFDTLYDQFDIDGSKAARKKELEAKAAAQATKEDQAQAAKAAEKTKSSPEPTKKPAKVPAPKKKPSKKDLL